MTGPSVNNRFEKPAPPYRTVIFHDVKNTDNFMAAGIFLAAKKQIYLKQYRMVKIFLFFPHPWYMNC